MDFFYLIGIVVASGSGKTTVAKELAELAGNASLMSQDNYYQSLPDGVDACDIAERSRFETFWSADASRKRETALRFKAASRYTCHRTPYCLTSFHERNFFILAARPHALPD